MSNTLVTGSAVPHPGGQMQSSRDLNAKVRVALDNLKGNMNLHLQTLLKMGNEHDSFTGHLKHKSSGTQLTQQQLVPRHAPDVQTKSILKRRSDINGRMKKAESFLDDYATTPIEGCLRQIEAMTLTDGGVYRNELIEREKRGVMMYRSLMMERDDFHSTPALKQLSRKYQRLVEKSIIETKATLSNDYNKMKQYYTGPPADTEWFPINPKMFSYTEVYDDLIQLFDITSDSFAHCKDLLDSITHVYATEPHIAINKALDTFMNTAKSSRNDFPCAAATACLKEMYDSYETDSNARATVDTQLKAINSGTLWYTLPSGSLSGNAPLMNFYKAINDFYGARNDPTYQSLITDFQRTKHTLRTQLSKFAMEHQKEQQALIQSEKGKDLPGEAIDAKGSRSRKIFRAVVSDNTAKSIFYVLTAKLSYMLYYEFPDESHGKASARTGHTPSSTKKNTQTDHAWTPYDIQSGELQDVTDYIKHVLPLFRPAASYNGYKTKDTYDTDESVLTFSDSKGQEYAFSQTGHGSSASTYGYEFDDPTKSYWVNPYTDDLRYLNTVFWHIRYKMELIDLLERYKLTQQDRREPSYLERLGDPVSQALNKGQVLKYYNELKARNYTTPERFMKLEGSVFENVCTEMNINPTDKIKLQTVLTNFKESYTTQKTAQDKTKAEKDAKRDSDRKDNKGESNLGETLSNFFFPQQPSGTGAEGSTGTGAEGSTGTGAEGSTGTGAEGSTGTGAEGSTTGTGTGAEVEAEGSTGVEAEGSTGVEAEGSTGVEAEGSTDARADALTEPGADVHAIHEIRKLYNEKRRHTYRPDLHALAPQDSSETRALMKTLLSERDEYLLDKKIRSVNDTNHETEILELKRKLLQLEEEEQTTKYQELASHIHKESESQDIAKLKKHLETVARNNADREDKERARTHTHNLHKLKQQGGVVRSLRRALSKHARDTRRRHTDEGPVIHYEARTPRQGRNTRSRRKVRSHGKRGTNLR
jgi:hypothetical protein